MPMPYAPNPYPTLPVDVTHRSHDEYGHLLPGWDPRDTFVAGTVDDMADVAGFLEWVGDNVVPTMMGVGGYVEVTDDGEGGWTWVVGDVTGPVVGTVKRTRLRGRSNIVVTA